LLYNLQEDLTPFTIHGRDEFFFNENPIKAWKYPDDKKINHELVA